MTGQEIINGYAEVNFNASYLATWLVNEGADAQWAIFSKTTDAV